MLELDVLLANDTSVDMEYRRPRLGKEVPSRPPGAQPRSYHCMKGNVLMVATRCSRVAAVRSKGPLEAVHSLEQTSSRAAHRAEIGRSRTPVHLPKRNASKIGLTPPGAEAH
jgi:hypothetical protein